MKSYAGESRGNFGSMPSKVDTAELRKAFEIIKGLSIPTPPALLLKLNEELNLPMPDDQKAVELIEKDIGLAARVLQVINSPAYNLRAEIHSIEHAVRLMGLKKLKDTIVRMALRKAMDDSMPDFQYLSEFSHMVGAGAALIAARIETIDPCDAYMAGLFHEVGAIFLSQRFPDYIQFHEENRLRPLSLPAMEKENYGASHPAIGFLLAKHWKLPEEVCQAIYFHHSPTSDSGMTPEQADLCSTLKLGSYAALNRYLGRQTDQSSECLSCRDASMAELMIDKETLNDYLIDCEKVYQ